MKYTTKQKLSSHAIYIVLALLIISIVCIAIATSLATAKRNAAQTTPSAPVATRTPTTTPTPEQQPPASGPDTSEPEKTVFSHPVSAGRVIKGYDEDVLVFSSTMGDYRIHLGMDLLAAVGDGVKAVADGTVTAIEDHPFLGKSVTVTHADGLASHYANLAIELAEGIAVGAEVKAGDLLGAIGETAVSEMAEESHLHFEMTRYGDPVDPNDYLTFETSVEVSGEYEG